MPDLAPGTPGFVLAGLAATTALMLLAWWVHLLRSDAGVVDAFWGPAVALAGLTWLELSPDPPVRAQLAAWLALFWGLRLAVHIGWRSRGTGEDRRYREIRARNEPGFAWKSLYLVFLLQAVLAFVVALPLLGVQFGQGSLGALDALGLGLFVFGLVFETVADLQLARFQRSPERRERGVMDQGLWRYSRHPNYFGEFCLWWGLGLLALAAGSWWALLGPALLTVFLLKVSGVALTEKDIADRRPEYREYVRRTSPFLPMPPRDRP
jgi:steroid 5-alpha reductase family enzyme